MNGVEILNQAEIITHQDGHGVLIGCIAIFLISIFVVILFTHLPKNAEASFYCGIFCSLVLGSSVGIIVGIITECNTRQDISTGKYEYQITISEDVKMQDFLEKYEIIEQNGKIYTVIERKE